MAISLKIYMHIYKLIIIVSLLIFGCSNHSKKSTETYFKDKPSVFSVNIEDNFNNTKDLYLNTLVDNVEYISLETNPNCLIRRISKIAFTSSFIFISDNNTLFQFHRSGKFVRQIGKKGKGPGEFIMIMGFTIDEDKSLIYIRDFEPKIEVFDFSGRYLKSFNSKFLSIEFYCLDSNKIVWSVPNMPKIMDTVDINLYITDIDGKVVKSFKNIYKRDSKNGIMFAKYPFYNYRDEFRYKDYGQDTLYKLNTVTYELEPYAIFTLGKHGMEIDPDFSDNILEKTQIVNKKLWISDVKENNDYLFITMNYGLSDSNKYCIYDKTNNNIIISAKKGFHDIADNPFWPKYIYQDTIMVDYIDAFMLRKNVSKLKHNLSTETNNKFNQLLKITEIIQDDDNPVLIIARP